ncbi:MAG: hypothetical protein WCY82_11175, partial [Desulfotomaculaceae bacterium]
MNDIYYINDALRSLSVYRNVLGDPIVRSYMEHLAALAGPPGTVHPAHTYSMVYNLLANTENHMTEADPWQNHLLDLILNDNNPFSQAAFAPQRGFTTLLGGVKRDLAILRLAFDAGAVKIKEATSHKLPNHPLLPGLLDKLPLWAAPVTARNRPGGIEDRRLEFKEQLANTKGWDELALPLAKYYSKHGYGV